MTISSSNHLNIVILLLGSCLTFTIPVMSADRQVMHRDEVIELMAQRVTLRGPIKKDIHARHLLSYLNRQIGKLAEKHLPVSIDGLSKERARNCLPRSIGIDDWSLELNQLILKHHILKFMREVREGVLKVSLTKNQIAVLERNVRQFVEALASKMTVHTDGFIPITDVSRRKLEEKLGYAERSLLRLIKDESTRSMKKPVDEPRMKAFLEGMDQRLTEATKQGANKLAKFELELLDIDDDNDPEQFLFVDDDMDREIKRQETYSEILTDIVESEWDAFLSLTSIPEDVPPEFSEVIAKWGKLNQRLPAEGKYPWKHLKEQLEERNKAIAQIGIPAGELEKSPSVKDRTVSKKRPTTVPENKGQGLVVKAKATATPFKRPEFKKPAGATKTEGWLTMHLVHRQPGTVTLVLLINGLLSMGLAFFLVGRGLRLGGSRSRS